MNLAKLSIHDQKQLIRLSWNDLNKDSSSSYPKRKVPNTEKSSTSNGRECDKKLNHQRTVFPSDRALLKALYLATLQATKKWTQNIRNWGKVYGEFSIMYDGRMPY